MPGNFRYNMEIFARKFVQLQGKNFHINVVRKYNISFLKVHSV